MTSPSATAAPPRQAAHRPPPTDRRYSEQIHALVDVTTRAYLLGAAAIEAERVAPGSRPKEGETVRELLAEAIRDRFDEDPEAYGEAVRLGRIEMERRAASKA